MKITDWLYVTAASIGMLFVTIGTRGSFAFLPSRIKLPRILDEALRYAPACALAAIVAPTIFTKPDKTINVDLTNPRLWAVVAAVIAFQVRRSMMVMMGVGLITFTVLRKLS